MLNQVVLVGRIREYDLIASTVTLSIPRSFKNEHGEYDQDIITINLWKNIASQLEYLNIGDLIGIKGRVEKRTGEIAIMGEKVTFLSNVGGREYEN